MSALGEILATVGESTWSALWGAQLVKGAIILLVAWLLSLVLRRRTSAAMRHQMWTAALIAVFALPLLSLLLPTWRVPVPTPVAQAVGAAGFKPTAASLSGPRGELAAEFVPAQGPRLEKRQGAVTDKVPAGEAPIRLSPSGVLAALWLTGAFLFLARLIISSVAAVQVVRRSTPVSDPILLAEVAELRGSLAVPGAVNVVENKHLTMPMAWGLLSQTILLPADAGTWSSSRRRVVLLHELAHLKRWDCQTLLLARAVAALHWFNPLAWLALRRLQAEREHACDDLVLSAGTAGSDYAQHLLEIARSMRSRVAPAWAMVAMARPSELEGRLLAILDPQLERGTLPRVGRGLAALALAALVLPLASAQPEGESEERGENAMPVAEGQSVAGALSARKSRIVAAFGAALTDDDPEVRSQAAHSLGRVEDAAAVPMLDKAVRGDSSAEVRAQSAWALGMIEAPSAVPALAVSLSDGHAEVRAQSAWALGMIEAPTAASALIAALNDPEAEVRAQTAWALGMIESADAVAPLAAALRRDDSTEVRQQAAWALGMIEAEAALDALLDALEDDDADVREQALWAVGRISG